MEAAGGSLRPSRGEGGGESQKSRLLVVNGLDNDAQIDVYFAGSRGEGL